MQPIKPQKSADAFILIDKNCEGCKEIKECLDDRLISHVMASVQHLIYLICDK